MLKPNHRYPFKEGAGYAAPYRYALTTAETIAPHCWVLDCWIVDINGRQHPGIDAVPVPVCVEDLIVSEGMISTRDYPCMEAGWG